MKEDISFLALRIAGAVYSSDVALSEGNITEITQEILEDELGPDFTYDNHYPEPSGIPF